MVLRGKLRGRVGRCRGFSSRARFRKESGPFLCTPRHRGCGDAVSRAVAELRGRVASAENAPLARFHAHLAHRLEGVRPSAKRSLLPGISSRARFRKESGLFLVHPENGDCPRFSPATPEGGGTTGTYNRPRLTDLPMIRDILEAFTLLAPATRWRWAARLPLALLSAVAETVGAATVLLLLKVISDPAQAERLSAPSWLPSPCTRWRARRSHPCLRDSRDRRLPGPSR